MQLKKLRKRMLACICMTAVTVTSLPVSSVVQAADYNDDSVNVMIDAGGYKTELFGTGTYDWISGINRAEKLPPSTVYLTENYKNTVGTVPTSDWASSVVFDRYSESLYAHPLAFRAASNGMQMATPAVMDTKAYTDGEPEVKSLLEDDSVEVVVGGTGFAAKDARVDKTTDWTYDVLMENEAGNASIMTTLAKGSPYAYYQFTNLSPEISLGAGATDLIIYKNDTSSAQIGIQVLNKTDRSIHYYGIYAPEGTTWTNAGGKLTASLPAGKTYLSIAALPDGTDGVFDVYEQYAYNFITNTVVDWSYHEAGSLVNTTYRFETTNQETGATGGDTIMVLYPHQYRYIKDAAFAPYTYQTVRGTMKTLIGSEYQTEMTYEGILPAMPVPSSEEGKGTLTDQISYYWDYYKNQCNDTWIAANEWQYGGYDTYWMGKNMNRLSDVILMSRQLDEGNTELQSMTADMTNGLKAQLEYWFDPYQVYANGSQVDNYFYYHKDYGTMIGYPAGYGSDYEVNDHHFHYGYWIKAAATIALYDPDWVQGHGGMVYELIDDIANRNRDGRSQNNLAGKTDTRYPFLRNFDIYEGHSWASGVANYEFDPDGKPIDANGGLSGGNNQESSTEAVNAWASLILWGEATGDTEVRDLGIYLYTTEVAAIEDYYFDIHNEVFTDAYEDAGDHDIQTVTRLWGGRYDHTAWWTEDPIEVTSISMLPMTGATLYLGRDKQKVKAVYDSISPTSKQWTDYLANKDQICKNYGKADMLTDPYTQQDILAEYYALYDPEAAMEQWSIEDINGKPYIEFGDSRAHTYGYIQSMVEYGTPNYEITGSTPFSKVFEKDGVKTYVAFNYSDEVKRVYFSDGTYVDVEPGAQYAGDKCGDEVNPDTGGGDQGEKAEYTVKYYKQKLDQSGYEPVNSDTRVLKGTVGKTVSASQKNYTGFTCNAALSSLNGEVHADGSLILEVYYDRNRYTLSYELNGGELAVENPSNYTYGETFVLNLPEKTGYVFEGWFKDAAFKNQVTGITDTTAGNLTLYAKWKDPYEYEIAPGKKLVYNNGEITFTVYGINDVTCATIMYKTFPTKAEAEAIHVPDGLQGFPMEKDESGSWNYTADFSAEAGKFLAICFNVVTSQGGTNQWGVYEIPSSFSTAVVYQTQYYKENSAGEYVLADTVSRKAEPDTLVTAAEKSYTGYTLDETADNIKSGTVTGDGKLILKLYYKRNTYTITYHLNGGSNNVSNPASYHYGDSVALAEPARDGYTFAGWYTNSSFTGQKVTAVSAESARNLELYAKWTDHSGGEPVEKTAFYTVKRYQQNVAKTGYELVSKDTEKLTGTVGDRVSAQVKSYTGFTFNADRSTVNGTVREDGTLELSFYYDRDSYTITYYLNGGTNAQSNPSAYVYGAGVEALASPSKSGSTFEGWYENAALTGAAVTAITGTRTGAVGLYAKWSQKTTEKSYTVSYDSAGGSSVSPQTLKEGEQAAKPKNPTRKGYRFQGWYLRSASYNFSSPVKRDLTLTAKWSAIKVKKIKITGISKKIAAGKKITLKAVASPTTARNRSVSFKTSNKKYAAVSKKGVVTLKRAGIGRTVTITATAKDGSGKKAVYKIRIMKNAVKKITLKASRKTVKAGKSVTVKAVVSPVRNVNKTVKWKSSNTKYATVNAKGVVKAKKAGKGKTVTITAMATDGSNKKKSIKLRIK